ncbi:neural-cadherin-like [Pelobates cultripes]|uniref:Neural-cadherin-like n=1 Tax=Pelobates cultripes TaxID=61616 RepID=A0AAD1WVP4_PELCU|nr:neural-cadherin-like [Pelobates cultripes]
MMHLMMDRVSLLCCILHWTQAFILSPASSWSKGTKLRIPVFSGSVLENWPVGTKVNGLNIHLNRINPEPWCSNVAGRKLHLQLLGEEKSRFEVYFHHRSTQLSLKTTQVLDREERSRYLFKLGLCCKLCISQENIVTELAVVTIHVLDMNDNAPQFTPTSLNLSKISLDETTGLKSVVHKVSAYDPDHGSNADLVYFADPTSSYFFVIPKTGQVVLVKSILDLKKNINLTIFARDHGQPPLVSAPLEVQICPKMKKFSLPSKGDAYHGHFKIKRSTADSYYAISIPEDAPVGSLVTTLIPREYNLSVFELLSTSPGDSPIAVNRETGEVTVFRTLDRERTASYECLIKVLDRIGKGSYIIHLALTIMDVNDEHPEWTMEPSPFLAVVLPSSPPRTRVYRLHAIDKDEGINGEIEYFLLQGGEGRFSVDQNTGWIQTTGGTLVEDHEYTLTVQAADKFGMRSTPITVSVFTGPRPPQFKQASYIVHVPETTPPGLTLVTVSALSHQNKTLTYSLSANPHGLFHIDPVTGEVALTQTVDFESDLHRFVLVVAATETLEQLESITEVVVEITDVNDCTPEFQQTIYSKDNVPETVPVSASLLQVMATDCDSGLNGVVSYYTLSPDFSISEQGTISPARELDYERPNHLYEFVILAIDQGEEPKTGTATVRIRIANVNDKAPEFSQTIYRTFVSEDAGPNTLVATVHAFDPDGDQVIYDILDGNREGNFNIDPQKGIIRLSSSLRPKLHGAEYVLHVTATDDNASGGPHSLTGTTTVIVRVDDINHNKPVFHKCAHYRHHTSVLENQPPGTVVLQVEATDADHGVNGQVKYGIVHREGSLPAFSIHPDTGVLTTLQRFDREKQKEFPVTIKATDQAAEPLIGLCQISIQILDENDNDPSFENNHYEYFLREDTTVGTSFLRVAARDDDYGVNGLITYTVAEEELSTFQINSTTGWLYVIRQIPRKSVITQEVIATDGGNRSTRVEVIVRVTDAQNQPPVWEKDRYELVVPENTLRDTSVVTIKASSLLGDPRVTYTLEEGLVPESNMPVRFYLTVNREEGSASVLVAEPLDYETTKNFILKIRAQNVSPVPLAAFTTILINITDVNDNVPFFTSSIYEATVTEGAELGTLVLQVSASDQDLGLNGEITYSILEDRSGDHALFHIDSQTGAIYTAAVFDRETKGSYLLEVKSSDGSESARPGKHGQPNSDTAYVRIFISDVNDNRPAFTQSTYYANVAEDRDVGSIVISVTASDPDEGMNANIRYQITAGNKGGVLDVDPETGAVFIFQPLNYEEVQVYELSVLASDGKWEDYATVILNVLNKNDEAPVFTLNEYQGHVTEELSDLPVFVVQVSAKDPDYDEQGTIKYSLHGNGANNIFTIDERIGNIFAQKTLDREDHAVWRFVVLATDEEGDGLTGFADVIIHVDDVNDNAPQFTCAITNCSGNVLEHAPANTTILEMSAVDQDDKTEESNAILTFSILNSPLDPLGQSLFAIDESSGTIYTAFGNLDREENDTYYLLIEVKDGGGLTTTGTATINVLDVNDHAPRFTQHSWNAMVLETSDINSVVLQLIAIDDDVGENALLTFSIVGGDPDHVFYIESNEKNKQAEIKLKKKLDYEIPQERRFNLTIKVEDRDFSTTSHCLIELQDCNDHSPVFIPSVLTVAPLFENISVGSTVTQVTAFDADSGLNGQFVYSIRQDSDVLGEFYIDQSGFLKVAKSLDREAIPQYSLEILASDLGSPPQTGSTMVFLNLLDVNDNGPTLERLYTPIVWENTDGPQNILMNETSDLLYAVDPDSAENGPPFTFSLPNDYQNSSEFRLIDHRNNTASIQTLRAFDREQEKTYFLPVIIADSGKPSRSTTNILIITIGDENDNPHVGGHKDIYIYTHGAAQSPVEVGKVFAPDEDDGDQKTFTSVPHMPLPFRLSPNNGSLMMMEKAAEGTYNFKIKVSDGMWPDVFSTVTIHVHEIQSDSVQSSVSLRITNVTSEELIDKDELGVSQLGRLQTILADVAAVHPSHIHIFSLTTTEGKMTDLRFAVCGSSCYKPEILQSIIGTQRYKVQAALKSNRSHVEIDFCFRASCENSSGCTSRGTVRALPSLVDSGRVSFVSVLTNINLGCKCPAIKRVHQTCSSQLRNPCLNAGTCTTTLDGYRCHCLPPFHGPLCQQTERSFHGNGYAWFLPISHCSESHLSLEFISDVPDGLLIYSGPLSNQLQGSGQNFMAIEITSGVPILKIREDSSTHQIQFPERVNVTDGMWHRIDIRMKGKEVNVTLDRCMSALIHEKEGVGMKLLTEDRSSCEIRGLITEDRRFWDPHPVLQLGGVKPSVSHSYPLLTHKHFKGCLRNVILNKQMYDLGAPIETINSSPGCQKKSGICETSGSSSCEALSRCAGDPGSTSCECVTTHNEQECGKVAKEHYFHSGSYIRYQFPHALNPQRTYFQTRLRTRHADGTILSLFSKDQTEYIHLQVAEGLLKVSYNIGDGDNTVKLPDHKIDTGEWNEISMERVHNEFTLRVNGGGGHREITEGHGTYKEIKVHPSNIILGSNNFNKQSYQGCLRDAKLNNYRLPMENQTTAPLFIINKKGVSEGCFSEACKSNPCSHGFICTDLWMKHECSCPAGYLPIENTTDPHCMYTMCAKLPCRHGTCIPLSPTEFTCHCAEGYVGNICHIPLEAFGPGLWFSTIYIISTCFLSLIVLMAGVLMWSHCKRKKRLNRGVYHVSAHGREVEDTRQNMFHYNEEGGGKEDHDAFNMTELQLSLRSSPMHTLRRKTRERHINGPLSCDYDTSVSQKEPSQLPASELSCSFTSGDFSQYFYDVFQDAAYIQRALSCDSLKVYNLEGDGSLAGSLSTLASSGLGDDMEYEEELKHWGPKFVNLCKLYSYTEEDELQ